MCRGNGCQIDLGLLPMLTGAVMLLGILTTYIIAVSLGHVSPLLPSISDTGIMSPEMHIFSQVLNIVAILAFVTFILRYKMIQAMLDDNDTRKLRTLTRCSLVVGCIASVGLSIVGNFQDNQAFYCHMTGAFMVFFGGNLYCILDAVIVKKTQQTNRGEIMFKCRLFLGIFGFVTFFIAFTGFTIAHHAARESLIKFSKPHWSPNNPGYAAHLVFTFAEWTMGLTFILYFFTHVFDFAKFFTTLTVGFKDDQAMREFIGDCEEIHHNNNGTEPATRVPETTTNQNRQPNEASPLLQPHV